MTSLEIHALEKERIWDHCWLYVGHEAELQKPGDFRRRLVGGRPIIFIHGHDGQIRALFNTCTHRGATICRTDEGNARLFQCFYHAWTFDTKGELVQVPDEEGYACLDKSERALQAPAQFDNYRGFYFLNYDPDAPDLLTYLDGATEFLDLVVDQSGEGLQILKGSNIYGTNANWKLLVENSTDGYHAIPTHSTYFDYLASYGDGPPPLEEGAGRTYDLGNGHSALEGPTPQGRPVAQWHPMFGGEEAKAKIDAKRQEVIDRVGEERGFRICNRARNIIIFPNFAIVDGSSLTFRTWNPVSPGQIHVNAWCAGPKGETPEQIRWRVDSYITFLGPGGFGTPDDVEVLESCQEGFRAVEEVEWSDVSRGMHRQATAFDELQMRTFWRAWAARIEGRPTGRVTGIETELAATASA
jgi:p-cumate 2,3-dioxygenase alpha subunit